MPLSYLECDSSKTEQVKAMQKVRKHYFDTNPIDGNTLNEYVDMMSDITIEYPMYKAVKEQAARSSAKTYFFE